MTDEQRAVRITALEGERKALLAAKREASERQRVAWEAMEDDRVRRGAYTGVPAGAGPGDKVVGEPVEKKFGPRFFKGVVTEYHGDEEWYLVSLKTP